MEALRSAVDATLPQDVTLRQVYVHYAAAPVTLGIFVVGPVQDAYWKSIREGGEVLAEVLRKSSTVCQGNETWIVAGYSQGALVVNNTLRNLPQASQIILLADPARVPSQTGAAGSASPGYGLYQAFNPNQTPLPSRGGGGLVSICDSLDAVCDTSNASAVQLILTPFPLLQAVVLGTSLSTHMSYVSADSELLRSTAEAAANGVLRALGRD
jgi:hypothetical protein